MIAKTDLRIGNYVKIITSGENCVQITGVTNEGVHLLNGTIIAFELVDPVAITQEILIQFGFIYGRKYYHSDFYDIKEVSKNLWEFKRNNEILKTIKYVHEAQNLFYCLRYEELKVVI